MHCLPPSVVRAIAPCLLVATAAIPARAQAVGPTPQNQQPSSSTSWSARAGAEWFSLRDVARAGVPVDASPVAWTGRGPTFAIRYDHERRQRLVRAEVSLSSVGHFSYDMGIRTAPRPGGDHLLRLDGRYECRWHPFRDLLVKGLDVGVGLQGLLGYVSLTRQMPPAIEIGQREARVGGGVVAALRFHHWQRFRFEAAFLNGGMVARTTQHHTAGADATLSSWGGGWVTDLSLVARTQIAGRTALVLSYLNGGEGHLGSHRGYATSRGHLMVGVTHVR